MLTINDIKPYIHNAKDHPEKQVEALANVVREIGWRQPVVVNQEGVIIVGHGRWLVAQRYQDIPDIWIIDDKGNTIQGGPDTRQLTPDQEKMWRLADNQLNAITGVDMKLVIGELKTLDEKMIELTGFSKDLLVSKDENEDVVPSIPNIPKSKRGDVYVLGNHTIMCGSSTDENDVATLMHGIKADMVFTDPPYNVNYSGRGEKTSEGIIGDNVPEAEFEKFLDDVFANIAKNTKDGGGMYIFHASSTQSIFERSMQKSGIEIRNQMIWNKPVASMGWGDYRWKHEPFFYAGKKGVEMQFYGDRTNTTVLDFQKTEDEIIAWAKRQKLAEERGKTTIWSVKRDPHKEYVHPTQKPVELIVHAIRNSSKAGDIVLDLFGGSGSTIIACEKMDRACFAMELDPKYADVIVQRYVDYTGNEKIIKNGEEIIWEKQIKNAPTKAPKE